MNPKTACQNSRLGYVTGHGTQNVKQISNEMFHNI